MAIEFSTIRRYSFPVVAVLIYAILAYVVLAGVDEEEPGKITLRFGVGNDATIIAIAKSQARAFEAMHPDVRIKVQPVSDQGILVLTAGKVAPDVFTTCDVLINDLARGKAVVDLGPLIKQDKDFDIDDFYPEMLALLTNKGRLYGLPRELSIVILYYNKTMFEKFDVKLPEDGWAWRDFLETAKQLTKDLDGNGEIDQYGYIGFPGWQAAQHMWVWQNGGSIFNEDLTECTINTPEAVEAFQFFYIDLIQKYRISPPRQSMTGGVAIDEFMGGRVAMLLGIRQFVPKLRQTKGFEWGVAPMPRGRYKVAASGTAGYAISPQTKHLPLAWKFLKFLVSRDGLNLLIEKGLVAPPRRSLANSDMFLNAAPPRNNRVFVEAAEEGYVRHVPMVNHFNEINAIIKREMDAVYYGKQTTEQACDRIKRQADKLLCD